MLVVTQTLPEPVVVKSFDDLVVLGIQGGVLTPLYANERVEEKSGAWIVAGNVVIVDLDNNPDFNWRKHIIMRKSAAEIVELQKERIAAMLDQMLEPETEWEYQHAND